ncbi:squamous cell carcinoma antigen recognized by T-cells 3-like protein, partial [Trifolium pratense]
MVKTSLCMVQGLSNLCTLEKVHFFISANVSFFDNSKEETVSPSTVFHICFRNPPTLDIQEAGARSWNTYHHHPHESTVPQPDLKFSVSEIVPAFLHSSDQPSCQSNSDPASLPSLEQHPSQLDLDLSFLVTPRLDELRVFRLQQESKSVEEMENSNPRSNVRDKRKVRSDIADEQSPAKRKKDASGKLKKPPKDNTYQVQNSSQLTKVEGTNQKNNKSDDNRSEQQLTRGKHRAYSDQCTAFISNLHPT